MPRAVVAAALTLFVIVLCGFAGALVSLQWWRAPLDVPESGVIVTVDPGDHLTALSERLASIGILQRPQWFRIAARLTEADRRIMPGEYRVSAGMVPADLLDLLQSGNTVRYLVTIPEGVTLLDAITILASQDGIDAVLDGDRDPRLLALADPQLSAEGLFLPETYQYERGDTDLAVLVQARQLMEQTLEEVWQLRSMGLPYEKPQDLLVMASIIEKETGVASERPEIGGVFVRRLQKGMRLQTDPSVIYGLGSSFDGNLKRRHLRDAANAYNSYRHAGLPPGPISLPGREALIAAANPATGSALYFVARGDGSHVFSDTLEAHESAVKEFQLTRKAGYRSSPTPTQSSRSEGLP